jgi:hypothetical protein
MTVNDGQYILLLFPKLTGGNMRSKMMVRIAGCLVLALVTAGCGQGNWKDANQACSGTDWDTDKSDRSGMAKIYQTVCGKDKVASDLRCKNKRLEVQCK